MNLSKYLKTYWEKLEKKSLPPSTVSKVNILEFDKIKKALNEENIFYIKNFIKKLYKGEAFILRNAAKKC